MSENESLCPDWIFLNNCNVHVAKDRAWFTTYTPFESKIGSAFGIGDNSLPVLGVGTVELTTKPSPTSVSTANITLTDVLHVPDYICNAIGKPILGTYKIAIPGGIFTKTGEPIACDKPGHRFMAMEVLPPTGYRFGPSSFEEGVNYMITVRWDEAEGQKWRQFKKQMEPFSTGTNMLSDAERAFLKKHYGGEFQFLRQHGLSIYKEEDREEGRAILRAIMDEEKQ